MDIKQKVIVEIFGFVIFSLILLFWFRMPLNLYIMIVIIIFALVVIIYVFNRYMNHKFIQSLNTMEREVERYRKDQDTNEQNNIET